MNCYFWRENSNDFFLVILKSNLVAQVWSPLRCLVVAETLANLYAYNPLMRLFRHFFHATLRKCTFS